MPKSSVLVAYPELKWVSGEGEEVCLVVVKEALSSFVVRWMRW